MARAIKNNEKKGRPLKFFIHRSKLQAGISEETQHTDAGACLRPLPLHPRPVVFAALIGRNTRLWVWDALPRRLIEILCGHHHQKSRLVIWNGG
jgi:hypothetical protein